jgi:hypothetical protein
MIQAFTKIQISELYSKILYDLENRKRSELGPMFGNIVVSRMLFTTAFSGYIVTLKVLRVST